MRRLFLWILLPAFGMIFLVRNASAEEQALYDAHGKRDPFAPLVTLTSKQASGLLGVETLEEIQVEGVVYDPKGSVVIINGTILKEGEELGSIKVVKVKTDGALLSVNGIEGFRPLFQDENKNAARKK